MRHIALRTDNFFVLNKIDGRRHFILIFLFFNLHNAMQFIGFFENSRKQRISGPYPSLSMQVFGEDATHLNSIQLIYYLTLLNT